MCTLRRGKGESSEIQKVWWKAVHERKGETIENRQAWVRERDQCDGFERSRNQVEKYRIGLGQRHTEKISNSENNMLSILY